VNIEIPLNAYAIHLHR